MIEAHLHKITMNPTECRDLVQQIGSTTHLALWMKKHNTLQETLMMLYAELRREARPSYVSRLYSRYRALSAERDKEAMKVWARKHCWRRTNGL